MTTLHAIGNWLYWFFGIGGSGPHYGFWSGTGSDIGEVTILGAVLVGVHHLNCHAKGCWRLSRHQVEGTPYKVCRKHHPSIPSGGPTLDQIHAAHAAHVAKSKPPSSVKRALPAKKAAKAPRG
jgi:hypothetical protein